MLGQQVLYAVDAETFTLGVGKEHVAVTAWRFSKPGFSARQVWIWQEVCSALCGPCRSRAGERQPQR